MMMRPDPNAQTSLSNKPLWVAMVALAIVAGFTISNNQQACLVGPPFDDTPNGLSGHLHKAMDNVMAIQARSNHGPARSRLGDTLIFDHHVPGSPGSAQTVLVFVDSQKGGLWAKYDDGRIELLAPAIDRMRLRSEQSGGGETLILELSAVLPTQDGDGPRANLRRIMSTTGNG